MLRVGATGTEGEEEKKNKIQGAEENIWTEER
jgi:hypothetical protein